MLQIILQTSTYMEMIMDIRALPFNESYNKAPAGAGIFINPRGEFHVGFTHESLAEEYCRGRYQVNLVGREAELLNLWESSLKGSIFCALQYTDFLVHVLGWHKISFYKNGSKYISTTHSSPYSLFFNYILMGWNVLKYEKYLVEHGKLVEKPWKQNREDKIVQDKLWRIMEEHKSVEIRRMFFR